MSCNNQSCPFAKTEIIDDPQSGRVREMRCIVSDASRTVYFEKGQILFLQGQPSTNLYSLSSGMVKICCETPGGREQIIGLSHPGKLLVGLQSIASERYAYSASAATPVTACRINHDRLLSKVGEGSGVAMVLIRALNAQLAHSRALMEVMGQKSAAAKIASLILLMVPESQRDNVEFSLPFSRREIANFLNLSEETVCRQMAKMKRAGIINAPRHFVAILDWHRLRAMTDGPGTECAKPGHP
jgi:CRP/FNR family transcriptional regulator